MTEITDWDARYQTGDTPWDTGRPSVELIRTIQRERVPRGRALELGCGTGTNALWLAAHGFDITAIDISALAIEQAKRRAHATGLPVRFIQADILSPPPLDGSFQFFFDRGCYHCVRRTGVDSYLQLIDQLLAAGAPALVLTGNAREPSDPGPPVVSEQEIRAELGRIFDIIRLEEFRFDLDLPNHPGFLAWSCWMRKKESHL